MPTSEFIYRSPFGPLAIAAGEHGIERVTWVDTIPALPAAAGSSPICLAAILQLDEYFRGQRRVFALPLAPAASAFQQQVRAAVLQVPYGSTATYAHIAAAIGRPRACRAVGQALRSNPLPLLIPCHRIIAKNGTLRSYCGGDGDKKRALLSLEARILAARS